ncbi:DUF4328 domain-containing protein [Streptomyces sp. NPDC056161]|uniref:DUF4328 domain-containing protein n=1 Tax=Streptomyces sp. NPDC056161 TaxID=3345732 RepID=UPI0035D77884
MTQPRAPRPAQFAARFAMATLLLAGAAWLVRTVWEIRLAMAGEPASGPLDQGDGVHRLPTSLEDSYHVVTNATGAVVLLCALAFIVWLDRVRDNALALSGQPAKYLGIWVWLSWIMPVVNLWFPRGLVADVHRRSAPDRRLPAVVNVWWALWLIGLLSSVGLLTEKSTDEMIELAYTNVWQLMVADVAMVGAAVAAVFMVRAITAAPTVATGGAEATGGM